jgi:hypothetical protein
LPHFRPFPSLKFSATSPLQRNTKPEAIEPFFSPDNCKISCATLLPAVLRSKDTQRAPLV